MTLASGYPLADLLWTFVLFFGLMIFFGLLFTVFGDLFRRNDLGGWAKTAWTIFVVVLPMIGVLTYLISQGRSMSARHVRDVERLKNESDEYIRSVAGHDSAGLDEIVRGKQLLDNGAISQDEFEEIKRRALV